MKIERKIAECNRKLDELFEIIKKLSTTEEMSRQTSK